MISCWFGSMKLEQSFFRSTHFSQGYFRSSIEWYTLKPSMKQATRFLAKITSG
jgi:hypothetical protein